MTVEEIRRKKDLSGFTAEELAKKSGVPIGTLQKILSGATKKPRRATLQALSDVLNAMTETETHSANKDDLFEYRDADRLSEHNLISESRTPYGLQKKQGDYTIGDYYAIPDDKRMELINGVLYEMVAPGFVHQKIATLFSFRLQEFIMANKGACQVIVSPVDVRLDEDDRTMVQPDVAIVCDESRIRRWGIMGAPDFVLEVISKSTGKKDYTIKVGKYLEAGVREVWLIDPIADRLLVFTQEEEIPYIGPLTGRMHIGIYGDKLEIDLDEIHACIRELPE